MFSGVFLKLIGEGILETLYMVLGGTLLAYVLGLPIGVLLVTGAPDGIRPRPVLYRVLNVIVNIVRSVPYLILAVVLIPFTRAVIGTALGPSAVIVSLTISAAPFIGRMVESSLREVDAGMVEAAQAMGASPLQIVVRVLLPEALPSLITGAAIALTTILGYSAMAGFVGGGGLGDIAVRYGYYRYQTDVLLVMVLLLVVIVQIFQELGTRIAKKVDKRNG